VIDEASDTGPKFYPLTVYYEFFVYIFSTSCLSVDSVDDNHYALLKAFESFELLV